MENKDQLQNISIEKLITIIQEKESELYKNILIDKGQTLNRANYLFYDYKVRSADRIAKIVTTPMWSNIEDTFEQLSGGESKHGSKAFLPNEEIIDKLMGNESLDVEEVSESDFLFDQDLEEENGSLLSSQTSYFIPSETKVEGCIECDTKKYVDCHDSDCDVRHEWTCRECAGKKKITCPDCAGQKRVECDVSGCNNGKVKCGSFAGSGLVGAMGSTAAGCNGRGHIYVTKPGSKSGQQVQKKCNKCRGRGEVDCSNCDKGWCKCDDCRAQGKISCPTCDARGTEICPLCYGGTKRDFKYAKIDCPTCKATGSLGHITFVQTSVEDNNAEKLMSLDNTIEQLDDNEIKSCVPGDFSCSNVFVNLNGKLEVKYDEVVRDLAPLIKEEFGLSVDKFKKAVNEQMYSKVIPCVALEYTHILTQSKHKLAIVNIFENPKVVFFSKPDETEKSSAATNIGDTIKGFFGKLFKTKAYKQKEDKRLEIQLMIRLMRADNKIEEEEKIFLVDKITDLDGFTNKEKDSLYELLNATSMPDLSINEVKFSSAEKSNEVVSGLQKLSESDGEAHKDEVELIKQVEGFIAELSSKNKKK
jgi:hypothetical protein